MDALTDWEESSWGSPLRETGGPYQAVPSEDGVPAGDGSHYLRSHTEDWGHDSCIKNRVLTEGNPRIREDGIHH